ncbi:MAG: helix-turn-helix transcriptional regulator [Clostridia bacterium]|nr:helix-turn-helix transcriptional regulator [Clostridia bacterium]MBQ4603818.1 helix-turn-helix transcriptional regulator [Clostridia bacterium]
MEYIITELKKALKIDGIYTIHYFEYTKDFAYSGEFHDFWEIVYADKKSVVITAGTNEMTLKAGQMYIHKPNEFHKIRCDGSNAANSVIISFGSSCPELFYVAGILIDCSSEEKRLMGNIINESLDAFSTPLGTPYTRVLDKSEKSSFGSEQMIENYLEQLLIRLIRRKSSQRTSFQNTSNENLLLKICEHLENNIDKPLSFSDIQKEFNTSASVIKRLFQSNLNCGIMEHFLRLKIDAAKQMIRENEYNFTEIAEKLAFNTPQYFSTAFKRISGMTPSEYEKSVKSNFS